MQSVNIIFFFLYKLIDRWRLNIRHNLASRVKATKSNKTKIKMKFIVALALFVAVAAARPQSPDAQAQIVSQQSDISPDLSQYSNS